ncbi:hypothetical protein GA0061071_102288 [Kosakonia oryzendophytica]|uniref:Uncharacterized protein n=1 Tax=Kosakonia oryzendophytica TaxID=1005665 RepID=A0A1C3ZZ53_9ENTR|nr:hypothetical protein GA0061071_102288 [Kosakonia oryzendophytica]
METTEVIGIFCRDRGGRYQFKATNINVDIMVVKKTAAIQLANVFSSAPTTTPRLQ